MPAVGTQLVNARREKTRLLIVPRWLVISTPWLYPDRFVHCLSGRPYRACTGAVLTRLAEGAEPPRGRQPSFC